MTNKANAKAGKRKVSKKIINTHVGNMLFMLPTIVLFTAIVIIPFIQGIPYSFTNWGHVVSSKKDFIGLANYKYLLTNKYFLQSLSRTFKYTVLYTASSTLAGLGLAMLVRKSRWFNNICRTMYFLPFTTAVTAGAMVWRYVFIDVYTKLTGLVSPLGVSSQLLYGLVIIGAWRDMGYTMLIFIAGLQSISQDYIDASLVDGCSGWQRFIHVILPSIVPAFTTNITLLMAWGMRSFEMQMVLARNQEEGQYVAVYIYDCIFSEGKAGLGQAAAVILTVILILLTQVITRVLRTREVEA